MENLKRTRGYRKGVLSRKIKTLRRYVKEEDVDGVKNILKEMKTIFNDIEQIHYEFHEGLEEAADISASDKWFDDLTSSYSAEIDIAKAWLKSMNVDSVVKSDISTSISAAVAQSSSGSGAGSFPQREELPRIDIPVFGGDPRDFQSFITIFDNVIGEKETLNDQSKLTRLLQYVSDEVRRIIQPCVLLGGTAGYKQARDLLQSRYGNVYLVSHQIVSDIKDGKAVIKPHELRMFADELSMAYKVLLRLDAYREINSQQFIKDALERCTSQVRGRWRSFALDCFEDKGIYPEFESFVKFIKRESLKACDPVYGFDAYHTGNKSNSNRYKVLSSAAVSASITCKLCAGDHDISQCSEFKALTTEQRFDTVRRMRLCFSCLKVGHRAFNCPTKQQCPVGDCRSWHHRLLHGKESSVAVQHADLRPKGGRFNGAGKNSGSVNACSSTQSGLVYLPIVQVRIKGIPVHALLDNGSSSTLVASSLVKKLGLSGENVSCNVKTVGSQVTILTERVSFDLTSVDDASVHHISDAYVVSDIPAIAGPRVDVRKYPYLGSIKFTASEGAKVELLIGNDHPDFLRPRDVVSDDHVSHRPYATLTKLGWVLQGPTECNEIGSGVVNLTVNNVSLEQVENPTRNLWSLERQDEDEDQVGWSPDDHKVAKLWQTSITKQEGHYVLPIPWKEEPPRLPNNKILAVRRLESTVKRLKKLDMYDVYHENMEKMLEAGHTEVVPEDKLERDDGQVWYLPHHFVLNDAKPGKVRIVFDCAAKYLGVSLNNQCYPGPDLVNKLLHVLLRFRQHQVAVIGDITGMYLQVRIPNHQRDSLRFLWFCDGRITEYRLTSHLFGGVWCGSSSTFALRHVLQEQVTTELVKDSIMKSMYVDDLLKSVVSRPQALEVIFGCKKVLETGGFILTKFVASDPKVLEEVPVDDRAQEAKDIGSELHSRALGLLWDVNSDSFYYTDRSGKYSGTVTRRLVLKVVAALYDPLGLMVPVVVAGRLLFQKATRLQLGWDDPLPASFVREWESWIHSLKQLDAIKFPRCLIPALYVGCAIEIHNFCDSSDKAYGMCSYVRVLGADGHIQVSLLMAKGRVAPLRAVTIPRLELCSAVLAVYMDRVVRRELQVSLLESVFWSDSQIVLAYIANESRRFKVFVANRVAYIRSSTKVSQWRYIPSGLNPADVITRGCAPSDLPVAWRSGPDFLSTHRSEWPLFQGKGGIRKDDPEVKGAESPCCVVSSAGESPLDRVINRYSSYYRMKKAVCWLRRWIKWMRRKEVEKGPITVSELQVAEKILIQHVQASEFSAELKSLSQGEFVKRSSRVKALSPEIVDGVLVVGERLQHASMGLQARCPMLLPEDRALRS